MRILKEKQELILAMIFSITMLPALYGGDIHIASESSASYSIYIDDNGTLPFLSCVDIPETLHMSRDIGEFGKGGKLAIYKGRVINSKGEFITSKEMDIYGLNDNGDAVISKKDKDTGSSYKTYFNVVDKVTLIKSHYADLQMFNKNGYTIASLDGTSYGIMDKNEQWTLHLKPMKSIGDLLNNNTFIASFDGKNYGVLNIHGNWLIEPIYDNIKYTADNLLYAVNKNGKWGCINDKGIKILDIKYAIPIEINGYEAHNFFPLSYNGLIGFFGSNGKWLSEPKYTNAFDVTDDGTIPVQYKKLWGAVDINGNWIIQAKYQFVAQFTHYGLNFNGLNFLGMQDSNNTWRLMDTKGNIIYSYNSEGDYVTAGEYFFMLDLVDKKIHNKRKMYSIKNNIVLIDTLADIVRTSKNCDQFFKQAKQKFPNLK